MIIEFLADLRKGITQSAVFTLSATPATVLSVTIPSGSRGAVLRPSADVRVAVDENPEAAVAGTLKKGATARANEDSFRLFGNDAQTLRIIGAAGSETVYVEFV